MSTKAFDTVLKELRALGGAADQLAASLEAMAEADEAGADAAPRSDSWPPPESAASARLRGWLHELLNASAACLVKGDGFGPNSYRILPPTDSALAQLDEVRERIKTQMEEAELA